MIVNYNSLGRGRDTWLKNDVGEHVGCRPMAPPNRERSTWRSASLAFTLLFLFSALFSFAADPKKPNSTATVTTCGNAIALTAASLPIVDQALVCGTSNDITTSTNVCGSDSYKGGLESLYTITPTVSATYNISISGQTWTGIFVFAGCPTSGGTCVNSVTSTSSTKSLEVSLAAGVEYFIMFDTWPSPNSPCPGTFSMSGPILSPPACLASPTTPANNATDISGRTFSWPAATGGITGYTLYLGTDGGGLITPTNVVSGQALGNVLTTNFVGDLMPSTTYYWQIVPINANGSASGCPIWSFTTSTTPGAATNYLPADMATGVQQNPVLSWTAPTSPSATSYDVYFGTSPSPAFIANQTGTSYTPGFLAPNATYYWQVIPRNISGAASPAPAVLSFSTSTGVVYCTPTTTNGCTDGDVIARVQLNTLDNDSGTGCPSGTLGYSDYSADPLLTTTLQAGSTYNATVWAGEWSEGYAAWIDYNDDGVFDASERIGYSNGQVDGSGEDGVLGDSASFPISLACNPPIGQHRLRVRAMFSTDGINVTPCGNNSYGEIEDYTITITEPAACPQPKNLAAANVTASSATLSWVTGCAETSWEVVVQGTGAGTPSSAPGTGVTVSGTPTYSVSDLPAANGYEFYVRANCLGDGYSLWTGPYAFIVVPNCATNLSPANAATGVARNTTLTWTAPTGTAATSYDVYLGTTDPPAFVINQTATTYTPTAVLDANTTYYWRVVPRNSNGQAFGCTSQSFTTGASVVYCDPVYTSGKTGGDLISNIVINGTTLSNNSGTDPVNPAYTYFTGQPNYTATLQAGSSYNVSVTVGTFSNQNVAAWIDYNDNGSFEASERIGFTTTSIGANGTASFAITLACNPPLGLHRLRIRDVYATTGSSILPCTSYGWGETEDYDITISAADPCPIPKSLTASAITAQGATLSWAIGCAETNWEYVVQTADSGIPTGSGTSTTTISNPVTGLNPLTAYEYYVRAVCEAGVLYSSWAGPYTFTTLDNPPLCPASLISPANGATGVANTGIVLSWSAPSSGPAVTSYDVYVGTTSGSTTLTTNVSGTTATINNLLYNTLYYWRVVPKNSGGSATGCQEFTFTTVPPPANDICSGATNLNTATSPIVASTFGLANDFDPSCNSSLSTALGPDSFYYITVPPMYTLVMGLSASSYDSVHTIFYGTCGGTQTQIACTDSETLQTTWLNETGSTQTVYWVQDAWSTGTGSYTLAWTLTAPAVQITNVSPTSICSNNLPLNVTLTGQYFTGATAVEFGGTSVAFTVNSDTSITATLTNALSALYNVPQTFRVVTAVSQGTGGSFTINESPAVNPISPAGPHDLCVGGTVNLTPGTPGGSWASDDSSVASVNDGLVTGVDGGSTTITYTVTDPITSCFTTVSVVVNVTEPIISDNPTNVVVTNGDNTEFSISPASISGTVTGYQWQISTSIGGSEFTNLSNNSMFSGVNTTTLSITGADNSINGYNFRLLITGSDACGDHPTLAASLTISTIGIETQPSNVSLCSSGEGTTSFTVEATGANLTYQWYTNDGIENIPLTDGIDPLFGNITYSGTNTATLSLSGITTGDNGQFYFVRVTSEVGEQPYLYQDSNTATLTVNAGPGISAQPLDVTACRSGDTSQFQITTTGAVNNVQWQYSSAIGGPYANIANNTPATGVTYSTSSVDGVHTLNVANTANSLAIGNYYYRAVIDASAPCEDLTSDAVALTVTTPTIGTTPSAPQFCSGGSAVAVTGTGASTYTWSPVTGLYTDAAATVAYTALTPATTVYAKPGSTQVYTITGTDANGCVNTGTVTVTVVTGVTVIASSDKPVVCPGAPVVLTGFDSAFNAGNVGSYSFTNTTAAYATIVGGAGTTSLTALNSSAAATTDDGITSLQALPFPFTFGATTFTSFKLNTNGWINLGGASTSTTSYTALSSVNNSIVPFSKDLNGINLANATYYVQTIGTAPNRIFKIEYANITAFSSTGNPGTGNFQIWLHETTNVVELRYGAFTAKTGATASTVTVGLRGDSSSAANVRSISNTGSWATPTVGTSSSATVAVGTAAAPLLPDNGRLYRFTPVNAPVYTYEWATLANPSTVLATTSQYVANPTVNTTYVVKITNAAGCSSTANVVIGVEAGPVITTQPVGVTTPSTTVVCQGTNVSFTVAATGPSITYQWYKGTPGSGEALSGATGTTYSITGAAPAASGSYYVVVTGACGTPATSDVITVTVNPTPTITAPAAQSICAGEMTSAVQLTGTPTGVTFNITGGSAIGLADVTGVTAIPAFTPIAGLATLTITPTANNCNGTAITVNYIVSPPAPAITVTPASATLCVGVVQQLTVPETLTPYAASIVAGTGTSSSSPATTGSGLGPNPFQAYYGGTKQQWIYRPAELSALGMRPGAVINAIKIDMAAAGSTELFNMIVKMKNSTKTAFAGTAASNWETGMTVVRPAASYTPTAGLNTIVLTTPFTWDGTNSLIIEINYSNNNGGVGTSTNSARYSSTSFVSTLFLRADNQTSATMDAYGTAGTNTYSSRNNVVFEATNPVGVTWTSSVANSLFTNAAGTTAYVAGTSTQTIYAKPSATATITATASTSSACAKTASAVITINPTPTITAPATQTVCSGTLTSPIAVVGTPTGVTFDISGGSSIGLSDLTGQTEIPAFTATGTSAVITLTPKANGCTGTAVTFTINVSPVTVGGAVTGGTSPINIGQSTGTMTLTGHVGSVVRWESAVSPFSSWTQIANTTTSYVASPAETTHYRAVVQSGACQEVASDVRIIEVNGATFTSLTAGPTCLNSMNVLTISGLIPNSTSEVAYTSAGIAQTPVTVVANGSGIGTFPVMTTASGQVVTVTSITRIDVTPNVVITPTSNNSVTFVISNQCSAVQACGVTLSSIDASIMANLVSNVQGYRWRITPLTGANAGVSTTLDTPLRVMKLTNSASYAFGTQYQIEVATIRNGVWGPYSAMCTVTTPVVTTSLSNCNQTLTSLGENINAQIVSYVTGYRFRITDPVNPTNTQDLDRPVRSFQMTSITNFIVQYGKTYNVSVALRNTDGTYMAFGSVCQVTTPAFPATSLIDSQCEDYQVPDNTTQIYAYSHPGAVAYVFKLTGPNLPAEGATVTKSLRAFTLSDFAGAGLLPGATYNVQVRLVFDLSSTIPGPYTKVCTIVTPGLARTVNEKVQFNAVAFPNPFAENFNIAVTTSLDSNIDVKVYDMTGRLLETREVKITEIESVQVGDRYPSGVYNVIVTQGDNVKTLRVIKR